LGFDPAPGDAAALQEAGHAWLALSQQLFDEAAGIAALHSGVSWSGRAASACVERLHVVPADLHAAASACGTAGRTLQHYADELDGLQRSARGLEATAAEQLQVARNATSDDDAHAASRELARVVHAAAMLHDDALARARDVAAVLAAARAEAPHSPSWFHRMLHDLSGELHHVAHAMRDLIVRYAPAIEEAAAWCSKAASVLAEVGFFLTLVPGVGDVAGGLLLGAAITFGTLALAGHASLAAAGVGSWKTVAFDGAALAVSLVSKGMEAPIEEQLEVDAVKAAAGPASLRNLPYMTEKEFALRAVKLHVDGAGAALGTVDLARIGEDWPVMIGRRRMQAVAGAA
jgi:hypothetical protein